MRNLSRVTITGADDNTDPKQLIALSEEFSFVEWGILVSARHEGTPRFPSRKWMDNFQSEIGSKYINLSMHVCGSWIRQLLKGELDWNTLPKLLSNCQRVQLNTHALVHESALDYLKVLKQLPKKQFIFQWDGVNDHFIYPAKHAGINVAALFDMSGGAGILPEKWPTAQYAFPCGYAGGLSPSNIEEQVNLIEKACLNYSYWVDMEGRVRTSDGKLDMKAVGDMLETVNMLMENLLK